MTTQYPLPLNSDKKLHEGIQSKVTYEDIHVSKSTFRAGLASRVHRWFRLTPSFGPDLVREMLRECNVEPGAVVLDPFSGAGTTLIECRLENIESYGFEINPFLHFVNFNSLNWGVDPNAVQTELDKLQQRFKAWPSVAVEDLEQHGLEIPPIHNPLRWWRADVLVQILILKREIHRIKNDDVRGIFELALAAVLVPDLTNVTLGRLQLHFISREKDKIYVLDTFVKQMEQVVSDLTQLNKVDSWANSYCFKQDATDLSGITLDKPIDAIVTSPPYPNRYSYVWNTRPHLYMLDFIRTGKEAASIDKSTIGGTWGTATAELQKGVFEPRNQAVSDVVKPVSEKIREQDNLMANYIMHYFNRLAKHIEEVNRLGGPSFKLAYVVGNSWTKGEYIETDVMLGDILERLGLGFEVTKVHRFRRRHSGKNLYESIVYAQR